MMFQTSVTDLIIENGKVEGVKIKEAKYIDDEEKPVKALGKVQVIREKEHTLGLYLPR